MHGSFSSFSLLWAQLDGVFLLSSFEPGSSLLQADGMTTVEDFKILKPLV
jgi:hypothetical protein